MFKPLSIVNLIGTKKLEKLLIVKEKNYLINAQKSVFALMKKMWLCGACFFVGEKYPKFMKILNGCEFKYFKNFY